MSCACSGNAPCGCGPTDSGLATNVAYSASPVPSPPGAGVSPAPPMLPAPTMPWTPSPSPSLISPSRTRGAQRSSTRSFRQEVSSMVMAFANNQVIVAPLVRPVPSTLIRFR